MRHACRLDGTKATEEDIAQARAWSSKKRADHSQQYKSKEFVSTSSDSDTSESSGSSRRGARTPQRPSAVSYTHLTLPTKRIV